MPLEHDADGIFEAVKGYVERGIKPFVARLFALEQKVSALPIPVNGKDGRDGIDGKDGAPGMAGKDGERGIDGRNGAPGMAGKDGERGIDGRFGPQGMPGPEGKDGAPGINGKDGAPGIDAIGVPGVNGKDGRDGIDGKTPDIEDIKCLVLAEVAPQIVKAVAEIKDGEPGRDGRDGKAGPPGRDALQIEPIQGIDRKRSYQRGTYALEAGGMLRAIKTTEPFDGDKYEEAGWQVVWNGVRADGIKMEGRTMIVALTSGAQKIRVPLQIYRGVWVDKEFEEGDTVTSAGSNWHANRLTRSRPGTDDSWTLMTKRGSDGKDGR